MTQRSLTKVYSAVICFYVFESHLAVYSTRDELMIRLTAISTYIHWSVFSFRKIPEGRKTIEGRDS